MTVTQSTDPRSAIADSTRPWGAFRQFVLNQDVTVKVIEVEPASRLSLQRHACRGEMWTVLDGPVTVTVDDRTWEARESEVVWVPQGAVHRIANLGTSRARVLEIAFGHFDEEDILRLEDDYARS